jgi:hypothetical protein
MYTDRKFAVAAAAAGDGQQDFDVMTKPADAS